MHKLHTEQVTAELKASRGGLEKALFNIASVPSGLLYGFIKGVNDTTSLTAGLREASAEVLSPVHGGVDEGFYGGCR